LQVSDVERRGPISSISAAGNIATRYAVGGVTREKNTDQRGRVQLSGWGRFPRVPCQVVEPGSEQDVRLLVDRAPSLIARGNGRAYGDAALNPENTVLMTRFKRILSFDDATGSIVCEAGVRLSDILSAALPYGWLPHVMPGTKHVTVGGMVAADVHGKNHVQAGSFAHHVAWLDLMIGDGSVVRCSTTDDPELFEATLGGMGLTGVVLRAAFALRRIESDLIEVETVRCEDLDSTLAVFETNAGASYAVAWVDLLSRRKRGRSVLQFGEHDRTPPVRSFAVPSGHELKVPIPSVFSSSLVGRAAMRALNAWRYSQARVGASVMPLNRFFFPLDGIADWNRLYGGRGLVQYQFVLPGEVAGAGLNAIAGKLAKHDAAPLLAVLKRFGPGRGMLSFPMQGYTLAMDFPATRKTIDLLVTLDGMVTDLGGRTYLAKDAISGPERIAQSYPELPHFRAVRKRVDPLGRFSSLLSRRLGV
jgi:decaprenylphospho-beta-D-ribofuranose 2-oxidase